MGEEMKEEYISKRIKYIKYKINLHQENIKLLSNHANEISEIKASPYIPRVIKYSCIPRSDTRFIWTLQNIKKQVDLLERELETLIKYGMRENQYE
jgi:hypothetical protein